MNAVYRYILCVVCTVILCGCVRILIPSEENSVLKMITGLVVTVVVLTPFLNGVKIPIGNFDEILTNGEFAVHSGISSARQATSEFIKEKSETYVLNKASELGAKVSVSVTLSDSDLPVPTHVTVSGPVSAYSKMKLSECICNELGVAEDEQVWIS